MFPLVLLLTQVCSASQSSLTSSTFSFQSESTHTGALEYDAVDGFLIEISSTSAHSLVFDLQVWQGDADIYVFASVNDVEKEWYGQEVGSDYLVITETDMKLQGDGLGLQRSFEIYIVGASTRVSRYSLTITALGASDWKVGSAESLKTHVATRKNNALFSVKEYKGDLTKLVKAMETGNSWLGVVGGVVLLGAGVVAWRKWGGRQGKNEESAYRFS